MFTAKQVANQLSISIRSVYRAIENGDLEHHRFPQIRISKSQLEAFKQKAVVATPATTHSKEAIAEPAIWNETNPPGSESNSARDNSGNEARHLYIVCTRCNAKSFSRKKIANCARCGGDDLWTTLAEPPWKHFTKKQQAEPVESQGPNTRARTNAPENHHEDGKRDV